tara:strand:+ start:63 stop:488 length:426 start_codon:yes stop_codon:yes gene_type:complete
MEVSENILKKNQKSMLKKWLKTELRAVYVTTNNRSFLHLNDALDCESLEQEKKNKEKKEKEKIMNIHTLISRILTENDWGVFFKGEPMEGYPTQDGVKMYKVNEITADRLYDAIDNTLQQMENECQENQKTEQTDGESSNG